jgi:ketosteroid isomerase-like protein
MSRQNVEAAREVLSAVERRDRSRLIELTDPEIEWRSFFADLSEYHGHDGLIQYLRDLDEAFEWLRPEVGDMLDVGDLVVGVGRIHYRGKESGAEADTPAGWLFRFSGGRLRGFRAFNDPEQALEAVGLRE